MVGQVGEVIASDHEDDADIGLLGDARRGHPGTRCARDRRRTSSRPPPARRPPGPCAVHPRRGPSPRPAGPAGRPGTGGVGGPMATSPAAAGRCSRSQHQGGSLAAPGSAPSASAPSSPPGRGTTATPQGTDDRDQAVGRRPCQELRHQPLPTRDQGWSPRRTRQPRHGQTSDGSGWTCPEVWRARQCRRPAQRGRRAAARRPGRRSRPPPGPAPRPAHAPAGSSPTWPAPRRGLR